MNSGSGERHLFAVHSKLIGHIEKRNGLLEDLSYHFDRLNPVEEIRNILSNVDDTMKGLLRNKIFEYTSHVTFVQQKSMEAPFMTNGWS